MKIDRRQMLIGSLAALAAADGSRALAAQAAASAWSRSSHSAIRLIAGTPRGEGAERLFIAGIEVELKPKFHTYWREPGDSGVPAIFDWSASGNVAKVDVVWPAPKRFDDASGHFIGYDSSLVLPLLVRPANPGQAAKLALKIDYAVCDMICIPAKGEAVLVLEPAKGTSRWSALISAAEAKAPRRVKFGEAVDGFTISEANLAAAGEPRLLLGGSMPAGPSGLDIFVEGPEGSMFGRPVQSGEQRKLSGDTVSLGYSLAMVSRPKAGGRHRVLITLRCDEGALEIETELDLPARTH